MTTFLCEHSGKENHSLSSQNCIRGFIIRFLFALAQGIMTVSSGRKAGFPFLGT